MKVQVTHQQVMNFHNEIGMWEEGSILFYFLNGHVQRFLNNNKIRIKSVFEKQADMISDHYVVENGQLKMASEPYPFELTSEYTEEQRKWEAEHPAKPVLTGKTTDEEHKKLYEAFLQQTVTLEL